MGTRGSDNQKPVLISTFSRPKDRASRVFLSYSHADAAYVERLEKYLLEKGVDAWFDSQLKPGDMLSPALEAVMLEARCLIVVMSPQSAVSPWVKDEIGYARDIGLKIFPLLLSGDRWMLLSSQISEDVRSGSMPSSKFVDELKDHLEPRPSRVLDPKPDAGDSARAAEGVTPPPAGLDQVQEYVAASDWRAADVATYDVLLNLCGDTGPRRGLRSKRLSTELLAAIDYADLEAIDRIWATGSDNRFGIAAKLQVWQRHARASWDQADEWALADHLGWRSAGDHLRSYDDLQFTAVAPLGHLPSFRNPRLDGDARRVSLWISATTTIMKRFNECQS